MKTLLGWVTIIALGLTGTAAMSANEWRVLFDGESTEAWRGYQMDSFPNENWKVENGVLKSIAGASQVDIISKDKYRDFELELEWAVTAGGNSGVIYHVAETDGPSWHTGPEMQVLDDPMHSEESPNHLAGALYDVLSATDKTIRPAGQFNQVRLLVRNNHVEHWLNGSKVVEYDLASDQLNQLIAKSKFKDLAGFAQQPEGYIALQHHGDEVWFRNIRIRALGPM